jgi:Flp pilus assembly protein TadD
VLAAVVLAVLPILADVWYVHGRSDLAVKADPLQAQYHWAIGTVDELRRAAELGETEPGMYVQLGDLEARSGDRDAARAAYRRALEIAPFYTPARQRLAALGT